jgi:hypothetical protein
VTLSFSLISIPRRPVHEWKYVLFPFLLFKVAMKENQAFKNNIYVGTLAWHCGSSLASIASPPWGVFPSYWLHAKNLIVEKNNKTAFLRQKRSVLEF